MASTPSLRNRIGPNTVVMSANLGRETLCSTSSWSSWSYSSSWACSAADASTDGPELTRFDRRRAPEPRGTCGSGLEADRPDRTAAGHPGLRLRSGWQPRFSVPVRVLILTALAVLVAGCNGGTVDRHALTN